MSQPDHELISADVKGDIEQLPAVPSLEQGPDARHKEALLQAIRAEAVEHNISVWQAIKVYRSAILWSAAFSLCIICDGYDTGLLGSLAGLPPFRQQYGNKTKKGGYQLTPGWQTAIQQASTIGNFFGIFLASWCQDRFGYRVTVQIATVWMTGALFAVFYAPTVEILFVGQLLCGFPWGAFSSSAVSYASEVTPIVLRAYLTTFVNLCWVIGGFLSAGTLQAVSTRTDQWAYKIPFALQWVWPVPVFVLVTLAPESPWYLVRKGRLQEAERSVARLSKQGEVAVPADVVAMMVRTNQAEKDNQPGTSYWDCFRESDLRRTEIACIAWGCQQYCGAPFVNQPVYFLEQAGLATKDAFAVGTAAKSVAFLGTCFSWFTLTYVGRRTVVLIGLFATAPLMLLIAILDFPAQSAGGSNVKWGQAALCVVWIFCYHSTLGPTAYVIVGESSSTRLRGKTVGLARNLYNISHVIMSLIVNYQLNPTAWNWRVAGTGALAALWAYFRLPEMKGRSFRELEILFERKVPARKFKGTKVEVEADH